MPRDALERPLIWLWNTKASSTTGIAERSFNSMADTVRNRLGFRGVKVKVLDGTRWQGVFGQGGQPGTDFPRLDGLGSLQQWIQAFDRVGLEFHATSVAWGGHDTWQQEAQLAGDVLAAGARSFTWDVEPPTFGYRTRAEIDAALRSGDFSRSLYWRDATWSNAARLVGVVRDRHPDACLAIAPPAQNHAIDATGPGSASRVPLRTFLGAGIDGVCPQIYWTDFRIPVQDVLASVLPEPGQASPRRVHPFGPDVIGGARLWPYPPGTAASQDVLHFRAWLREHSLSGFTVFRLGGPGPAEAAIWKLAAAELAAPGAAPAPGPPAPAVDRDALDRRLTAVEQEVAALRQLLEAG